MNFPIRIFDQDQVIDIADETTFAQFSEKCLSIGAAGGIVINEHHQVLMIYRLSKWDFPKGKIEEGECPQTTAQREVGEETGLVHTQIVKTLPSTFHTYPLHGKKILKQTHWFLMHCSANDQLNPQLEEDIEETRWVPVEEVSTLLLQSYDSLKDFWEQVIPTANVSALNSACKKNSHYHK